LKDVIPLEFEIAKRKKRRRNARLLKKNNKSLKSLCKRGAGLSAIPCFSMPRELGRAPSHPLCGSQHLETWNGLKTGPSPIQNTKSANLHLGFFSFSFLGLFC
jgi:hypothetical protein